MNDDIGFSPVAIGVVIAVLVVIGNLIGHFFTFAAWATR
jgi:hypothetical protein